MSGALFLCWRVSPDSWSLGMNLCLQPVPGLTGLTPGRRQVSQGSAPLAGGSPRARCRRAEDGGRPRGLAPHRHRGTGLRAAGRGSRRRHRRDKAAPWRRRGAAQAGPGGRRKKTLHSAHLSVSPSAIAGRRWALAPGRAFAPPHVHTFANFLVLS